MKGITKILNISITKISYKAAIDSITKKAISQQRGFYCFSNAHMAVESLSNKDLAKSLEHADMNFADGFPIAKSMRLIHNVEQERIAGMDFLPSILKKCNEHALRLFFIGTTKDVLDLAIEKINKEFPNVVIAGTISPPFNQIWDNENYIELINESRPHMVFVSLGCPKQEIWMGNNYKRIPAPLLGIGGALIVFAGVLTRAPLFVQKIGFEWLYRLFQEPGRLWKRYLFTNSMFLFYIFKQWIKVRTEKIESN